jgi:undecaprenyl-diphosphatase
MSLHSADENLFLFINKFAGDVPGFDFLVRLVVNEYFVPVTLALVIVYIWFAEGKSRQGSRKVLLTAALSVGLLNFFIEILNQFIVRARPFDELPVNLLFYKPTDPSFPSNAAAIGFVLGTSIFLVNKRLGVVCLALAAFYGFSRVYAGVHFPSDVVAGALMGILTVLLVSKWKKLINTLTSQIENVQSRLKLTI